MSKRTLKPACEDYAADCTGSCLADSTTRIRGLKVSFSLFYKTKNVKNELEYMFYNGKFIGKSFRFKNAQFQPWSCFSCIGHIYSLV